MALFPVLDTPQADFDTESALRFPIGAASPLWLAFASAAGAGVAYWWMTRWTQYANLAAFDGFAPSVAAETPALALATPAIVAEPAPEAPVEAAVAPVEAAAPVREGLGASTVETRGAAALRFWPASSLLLVR